MITENNHLATSESQINTWVAEINELRCEVEQMGRDARASHGEQLETTRARTDVANKDFARNARCWRIGGAEDENRN